MRYKSDELRQLEIFNGLDIYISRERNGYVQEFYLFNNNKVLCTYSYKENIKSYVIQGYLFK